MNKQAIQILSRGERKDFKTAMNYRKQYTRILEKTYKIQRKNTSTSSAAKRNAMKLRELDKAGDKAFRYAKEFVNRSANKRMLIAHINAGHLQSGRDFVIGNS